MLYRPLGKGQLNISEPIPIIKHGSKGVAFGWCRQQYQSIQLGDQDAIRDNVRGFLTSRHKIEEVDFRRGELAN